MSLRNVVTSCGRFAASRTATVPCSTPTGTVRLNSRWTSWGGAAVVRSKSWFSTPSKLSRIAPPTHHVSKPACSSRLAILSTSSGIGRWLGNSIREGSPAQHTPAVHIQDFAGDIPRQVRAQEDDRSGNVVGTGHTSKWNRARDCPLPLSRFPLIRLLRHLGIYPSRRHAVDGDTRRELDGERLGERNDRAFGGGVVGVERLAALARCGGDKDDLAIVPPHQVGNRGTAHVADGVVVGPPGLLPLRVRHGDERGGLRGPGR